ncbi:MAG: hypothetical protein IIZ61_09445 [Lachnospiraceae bacterium]|nr:hypothetical protein [Lachnospiraceae bacterium]
MKTEKDLKKRTLLWIIGLLLCFLGILSAFFEELMIAMSGLGVFGYGVGMLVNWTGRRKTGTGGNLLLAGSIVGMACGVLILVGGQFSVFAGTIVLFVLAAWFIAVGILEIIAAVIYRKAMTSIELGVMAPGSISSFVTGIIMVSAGAIFAFNPFFADILIRIMVCLLTVLIGVRLILSAFFTDRLWKAKKQ